MDQVWWLEGAHLLYKKESSKKISSQCRKDSTTVLFHHEIGNFFGAINCVTFSEFKCICSQKIILAVILVVAVSADKLVDNRVPVAILKSLNQANDDGSFKYK